MRSACISSKVFPPPACSFPCVIAGIIAAIRLGTVHSPAAGFSFADADWQTVGTGMNGRVSALAVSGSNVYVGGQFSMAGAINAANIAVWNGSAWAALGQGVGATVRAIAISGTNVYAGGDFTTADGNPARHVAKWNGSTWSALGNGLDPYFVAALAVSGNTLYAGGSFSNPAFTSVRNVAAWNGSSWSALGSGVNDTVYSLAVSGANLYVGGDFTQANGAVTVNSVARWNGSSWSALGTGMAGSSVNSVYALAVSGSTVYAGGLFLSAGGAGTGPLAKWNGSSWSAIGIPQAGTNYYPSVYALGLAGSALYVGGDFTKMSGLTVNRIASYEGTNWSPLGSGMETNVETLVVSGCDLYAAGRFNQAGDKTVSFIARGRLPLPALSVRRSGTNAIISWPSSTTPGVSLEETETLPPIGWVPRPEGIFDDGTNQSVTIPLTNLAGYYRLRRP